MLKLDEAFTKKGDMATQIAINGLVGEVDGVYFVKAPKSYFPEKVHFIITNPIVMPSPIKLAEYKIHDDAPGISGYLVEGRVRYDAFVLNKETKGASQKKAPTVDSNGNYDYSAIEKYVNSFGEASSAAENFRSKLQTLKGALGVLKDGVVNSRVAKMASALKNATVHSLKFAKSIGKISLKTLSKIPSIVKTASKPLKALGSAIGSAGKKLGLFQKSSNKGMSFGRMIGSSIMFSTIFGAISQIKQAVKEGSDNLVQYSSEYNNSISSMVSSLLYLKNAWAVAFAPIVNVVGPYISSFIDMVAGALNAVGQLMASLTGKSYVVQAKKAWKDYAAGLDTTKNSADDAGKSIKDLENYTLGIDELNVIQPSDNSGSSGSGSGSGSGSTSPSSSDVFATTDVDGGISELAKKIKEAWKNADFTEIGGIVGRKLEDALDNIPWDGIQEKAIKIGKSLGTFINGAVETQGLGTTLGQTIGEAVNTGIYCANAFLDNTKWDEVGKFIGDGFNGLLDTIDFTAWGHYFAQKWNAVFATIGEAARTFDWTQLGVNLAEGVNTFVADFDWVENGARLSDTVKGLLDAIITFLEETDWQQIGEKCADFIGAIDWIGIAEKIAEGIGAAVGGLSALVWGFIKDAWEDVVKWWKDTAFEDGKFTITGLLDGILEKIKDIGTWVKEHIVDPFIDGFCEAFGIHSPSTVMKEKGNFIMDGLIGGVTDKFQSVIDFFSNLKDSMGSLYVYEWSASDEKATIKAVDVLKFLEDDYYKGQYYEKGISLYDLAELVFADAGVGNDDYYLDTYLKKVTVYNPLPKVKHKEALQIIANAGRCVLDYDRYGRIRIHSLFQPSMETTSNGTTYYSDIKNVDIQTQKSDFATYEKNRWLADGKMLFLSKEDVQNTGYVSSAISDENGLFTENPVITRTLEAKYKAYGIYIAFSNKLPKKFIIRTYADNVLNDTLTIQSGIANDFEIQYDFPEYDKMEIEFVETEPNSRIHVDYISIGSETSYRIEYDDLYSTPVGTQLDRIKNVRVARYLYSKSSVEDELATEMLTYDGENAIYYMSDACYGYTVSIEDGKSGQLANVVSSGAYYVEIAVSGVAIGETVNITVKGYKYNVSTAYDVQTVNNRGTDKEWQNPIISNAEHSKQVATWLADYFSSGIEYELDYRGEPAIDCGDTIGQENKYDPDLKTIVEESQITLNAGLLGGGLVTRRKNSVARTKN